MKGHVIAFSAGFQAAQATSHRPGPHTALPQGVPELDQKDTATLWESLRVVEMADRLGQKLREESGECFHGEWLLPPVLPPSPGWVLPKPTSPTPGPPASPIYKLDIRPGPNLQLCCGDSQNQKQINQPESLGEIEGRPEMGKSIKSCWGHRLLSSAPHPERSLT